MHHLNWLVMIMATILKMICTRLWWKESLMSNFSRHRRTWTFFAPIFHSHVLCPQLFLVLCTTISLFWIILKAIDFENPEDNMFSESYIQCAYKVWCYLRGVHIIKRWQMNKTFPWTIFIQLETWRIVPLPSRLHACRPFDAE